MSGSKPVAIGRPMYMMAPDPAQMAMEQERARLRAASDARDIERAAAPRVKLMCVASFTVVSDDAPNGKTVERGDLFEVSEYDLPHYLGRGLPPEDDSQPARHIL